MSYKKTALIPGNIPNEEVQRDFIKDVYETYFEQAQQGEIHLLFSDPTHKIHNTINGKCWQPIGKDGTIKLPSNTGRRRVTILGAINAVHPEKLTSIITEANCDQEMAKKMLEEIRKDYPDDKEIVIIEDNAKYHHAYSVTELARTLNITIAFLPPYCPNLNLIERIWKFMKKEFKNEYFPTFKDFWKAILDFCGDFGKHEKEIKRLIGQKFQIIKAV